VLKGTDFLYEWPVPLMNPRMLCSSRLGF
jgi:hypothetical protein